MPTSQPQILMCPPEHYGIEYEINPWMNRSQQADRERAIEQWQALRSRLEELGAQVSLLDPVPGLPDLVFTANAALIYGSVAVLSHFRHTQRQGEEPYDAAWFESHGFEVRRVPNEVFFEGAGDALFCGDTLFAGYRIRSDAKGHQRIGTMIGCRVIPLELVNHYYYHLDTCFCPLEPGMAIYFPAAFDAYGQRVLAELVPKLIPVAENEAQRFACNAVVVGRSVVTNIGCHDLHARLREHGYTPYETPLDEFVKAGGSAKCLTLRLDGEEAAAWRATGSGLQTPASKTPRAL
ncbi:MAG TPA: arginine deiminase-related protein [Pirellulales bacterium]|jgi:N-dimethylarginine dimethylaminohydrolase|nr:arginine deiminase-related protein [Pirellulales bacterium]